MSEIKRYKAFDNWSNDCPIELKIADEYEALVDTLTNEVVCILTEPEDRTFYRDLSVLVCLLNNHAAHSRETGGMARTCVYTRRLIAAPHGVPMIAWESECGWNEFEDMYWNYCRKCGGKIKAE